MVQTPTIYGALIELRNSAAGVYGSRALLNAANVPASIKRVFVRFYDHNDTAAGGGHWLRRLESVPNPLEAWHELSNGGSRAWVLDETTITPLMFGAKGDGDGEGGGADDSAAFAAMLAYAEANPGTIMDGLNRTYLLEDDGFEVFDRFHLRNCILDCSQAGQSVTMFTGGGTEDAPIALTSNGNQGDGSLSLADASGISPGDWGFVESDEAWGVDEEGRVSELVQVQSVDGNTARLVESLDYRYLTSQNARFAKLNPVRNVRFENVELLGNNIPRITGDPEHPFFEASPQVGVRIARCQHVRIINCKGSGFGSRVFGFDACWDVVVEDPTTRGLADGEGLNYGIAFTNGCHHCTVRGGLFSDHRHSTAIGGTSRVNRHLLFDGLKTSGAQHNSCYDGHRLSDLVTFTNCHGQGGAQHAFELIEFQGARLTVNNCTAVGRFTNIVRHSMLVAYDRAMAGTTINGLNAKNTQATRVVWVRNHSTTCEMVAVSIAGVNVGSRLGTARPVTGIEIDAANGVIRSVAVSACPIDRVAGRAIYLQVSGSGQINDFAISGNPVETVSTSVPAIEANAGSGAINNGAFTGNVTRGGSHSIRGIGTTDIQASANQDRNSANGIVIDGLQQPVLERYGEFTGTTDGSGDLTIPHGLPSAPAFAVVDMATSAAFSPAVRAKGATNLTVRVRALGDGANAENEQVTVQWYARV